MNDDDETTAEDELQSRAKKLMKANAGMSYEQAYGQAAAGESGPLRTILRSKALTSFLAHAGPSSSPAAVAEVGRG